MRYLAAVFLALLVGCGDPYVPNLHSSGVSIVCFGDSITAGTGRGNALSYPEILAEILSVPVINAGVPGETTVRAVARIDEVLSHDPWLVIVELGGNDLLHRLPIEETERAIATIVERILDAGAVPMVVEVHGPFGGQYRGLFADLESRFGMPLVEDVLPEILMDRSLKSDTIHPNAKGYEVLAEAIAEEILPLLRAREAVP